MFWWKGQTPILVPNDGICSSNHVLEWGAYKYYLIFQENCILFLGPSIW